MEGFHICHEQHEQNPLAFPYFIVENRLWDFDASGFVQIEQLDEYVMLDSIT